ncbi:equilibrative nucleotide transporter 3 [Quercus suber]|uniref:Equilibrative nucleotide transporter 3 n=1 Tax=Quercus suber TaxID=58331 RepID=A0AAW0KJV8_QUESU
MTIVDKSEPQTRLQRGKYKAVVVCWILGLGSLMSWNSMLTIGDYYYKLFPLYHPSRVLTLVYQPFAFVSMALLAYNESKFDTRWRNLIGYSLFFASTVMLIVVSNADTVILFYMPNSILQYCTIRLITSHFFEVNSLIIDSNKYGSTFHSFLCETYNESKIDTRWRNLTGYSLFFASTVMLIVVSNADTLILCDMPNSILDCIIRLITSHLFDLDIATSGKGGVGPYIGICAIVDLSFMHPELIQVSSAQSFLTFFLSVTSLSACYLFFFFFFFPPGYQIAILIHTSFLAGLAASGTLTSVMRIITKAAFEKSDNVLFLAISAFFEFLCVILYAFFFPKLPLVKYYRSKAASEGSKTVSADLAAAGIQVEADQEVFNKQLFFENIDYAIDLFLIYVLTLSIFPGFLYENTGTHQLGSSYPLVLIAMYSVWDFLSRYIPLLQCLKMESRKGLMIATLSRFLLIPAFYFTAKYGDQGWMIMLISFLGLSNGYLTVCILTVAPKGYKGPEQNALGNLLVLCLLGGIFAGVALDWLWLIAMVVCGILGLGCLVSWNSLLTIGDYYYELVSAVLTYKEAKINTRWWNLIGYTLFFASTLSLLVVSSADTLQYSLLNLTLHHLIYLDLATSGKGGVGPYIGICVIVCFIGVASANVQGGMVGELSFMLPELIQSFLAGWAAAGTLTSVLRLLTKAAFEKSNNVLFLAISTFITFLCFILYASYFPSLPIVVYYRSKAASEGSKTVSSDLAAAGIQAEANQEVEGNATPQQRLSIKQLFFQNIDYALDLFLIYAMTLSIFPGFIFENTGAHQLGSWYPLVLITMFNAWDFIARYIPLVQCLKIGSRKGLMIAVLSRFLLIPAYYFTAKYGDQGWMIILTSFLGISNGYLTVCILKIAPKAGLWNPSFIPQLSPPFVGVKASEYMLASISVAKRPSRNINLGLPPRNRHVSTEFSNIEGNVTPS